MLLKIRVLIGVLFFAFFAVSAFEINNSAWGESLTDIDNRIAEAERIRERTRAQLEAHRRRIAQLSGQENNMIARIDRAQVAREQARLEIEVLELQIQRVQGSIVTLNDEMAIATVRIGELVEGLNQRLLYMYKFGTSEELLVIFAAEDTNEILNSIFLMQRLADHDRFLIEQLQHRRQDMEMSMRTLEDHRDRLGVRSRALENERQRYDVAVRQTNTYLNNIRNQRAAAQRAAREEEEAQRAVGNTIAELTRRREAERRAGTGTNRTNNLRFTPGQGDRFDWPVRGPISSPFGQRTHPIFRTRMFHSGIDIAAPRGTPVITAGPGEVIFEGWMRGFGRVIIIDHGSNFTTVYAHLSDTRVREGTVVGAGAVIGAVGNTGNSTGYHLHFEVREGSTARNPINFLRR